MTTVTVDRAVLEQALEALEQCGLGDTHRSYEFEHAARAALRAALAQQERHVSYVCPQCYWSLEQPEPKQEPVAWQCQEHGDTEWFDCSKESYGINPRRYTYRALYTAPPKAEPEGSVCARCGALAFDPVVPQAEPLNLSDRAVQRRLAAQWGYVPAQAEPAQEQVVWIQPDHLQKARVAPFLCRVEPTQRFPDFVALYTAPPSSTMVPLTDEEILAAVGWERAEMYMKLTPNFPVDEAKKETLTNARAVEKAVWEKNHGQA